MGDTPVQDVLEDVATAVVVRRGPSGLRILPDRPSENGASDDGEIVAWAPPLAPSRLGNPEFGRTHGVRYAYVVGEMANGIASEALVAAAARARLLAFFGAGGLEPGRVAEAVHTLKQTVGPDAPLGFSLLHDVHDLLGSQKVVDLYLEQGIRCVNASAFITLTPPLVQYRVSGIHQRPDGEIVVPNRTFAKISRAEVARRFMEPPPPPLLDQLLREGRITEREAELARHIPMADDITAEGDSGGHTDKQVLSALVPTMRALRDEIVDAAEVRPADPSRRGRRPRDAGVGRRRVPARRRLRPDRLDQPGVRRGRHLAARAADAGRGELQRRRDGRRRRLVRDGLAGPGAPARHPLRLAEASGSWSCTGATARWPISRTASASSLRPTSSAPPSTRSGGTRRRSSSASIRASLSGAQRDEHHKMALVMRWYLGLSSGWAQQGNEDRRVDFQVWCGPAMGAFNTWARGSFLEDVDQRGVVEVAENLMHGAAALVRRQWLTAQGVPLPESTLRYRPRRFASA